MKMAWKPVMRTGLCLLVGLTVLVYGAGPSRASEQRLVVAGAPQIHETTLPHLSSVSSKLMTRPIYEYLVDVDPATWDYTKPMLAERWQVSPDAKTWTFFLRRGIPFHGGWGDVTPEDVKYYLELLPGKDALASTTAFWRMPFFFVISPNL